MDKPAGNQLGGHGDESDKEVDTDSTLLGLLPEDISQITDVGILWVIRPVTFCVAAFFSSNLYRNYYTR